MQFYNDKFHLRDLGSKRGTFINIDKEFSLTKDMKIFTGNKILFQVSSLNIEEDFGEL